MPAQPPARPPRHLPQRRCVVCRRAAAKRDLIRIVRAPEGPVDVDPTGRRPGRGAYVCRAADCWQTARLARLLGGALHTSLGEPDHARLLAAAAPLVGPRKEAAQYDDPGR